MTLLGRTNLAAEVRHSSTHKSLLCHMTAQHKRSRAVVMFWDVRHPVSFYSTALLSLQHCSLVQDPNCSISVCTFQPLQRTKWEMTGWGLGSGNTLGCFVHHFCLCTLGQSLVTWWHLTTRGWKVWSLTLKHVSWLLFLWKREEQILPWS